VWEGMTVHKSRSIRLIICAAVGLVLPLALPSVAQAASGALDAPKIH